jgi:AcrR family transcriptional regulator
VSTLEHPHDVRALRADAQRNLGRILEAAREVFAREGIDASIADVAARAGVGTATIFRRFPVKEDLLAAVVEQRLEEIAAVARRATAGRDAAKGLRQLMTWGIESYLDDRCYCESIGTAVFQRPRLRELKAEIAAATEDLLRRAKETGAVRRDVTADDVSMLFFAVAQAAQVLEPARRGAWRKYLDIVLDGLRPRTDP